MVFLLSFLKSSEGTLEYICGLPEVQEVYELHTGHVMIKARVNSIADLRRLLASMRKSGGVLRVDYMIVRPRRLSSADTFC